MLQENELVMLALGVGVLVFVVRNLAQLRRIPHWPRLFAAFLLLLTSWAATVVETWLLPDLLNALEHAGYMAAAVMLAWWCHGAPSAPVDPVDDAEVRG